MTSFTPLLPTLISVNPLSIPVYLENLVGRHFSALERAYMNECYIDTGSIIRTIQQFNARFPHRNEPLRNMRKYRANGISSNLNRGSSGRRRTAAGISAQNINLVQGAL